MICEVCGKDVPKLHKVLIEGAVMNVCDDCAKLGIPLEKEEKRNIAPVYIKQPNKPRENRPKERKNIENQMLDNENVLVENYGELLRNARMAMNLSLEDAAKKLQEKKNVLSKLERGEMKPDKSLIRKLEKFYNIKLTEKVTSHPGTGMENKNTESMTLGDLTKKKE